MKSIKMKYILLMVLEIIILSVPCIILYQFNSPNVLSLVLYILLIPVILWLTKTKYEIFNDSLKQLVKSTLIILVIGFFAMIIAKNILLIPSIYLMAYEFFMGSVALNYCLDLSKISKQKRESIKVKFIGFVLFSLSIIIGILALFGIAK